MKTLTRIKDYETGTEYNLGEIGSTTATTYAELLAMVDGGTLVAGQQYRITDFVTTVANDAEARSAGHAFDLIVVADDEKTLNAAARAIAHDGDTYFANADLSKWQVWYDIHNDTTRYQWADTTGKGVIYRLIDEWQNDCPYDFKNVQFKRYKTANTKTQLASLNGLYLSTPIDSAGLSHSTTDYVWCYTFAAIDTAQDSNEYDWTNIIDATNGELQSIDPDGGGYAHPVLRCEHNIMLARSTAEIIDNDTTNVLYILPNNVLYSVYKWFSEDDVTRHEIEHCCWNELNNSVNVTLMRATTNHFGDSCDYNTFGDYCYYNTFGDSCYSNTFGNSCYSNTFGDSCDYNTFGDYCYSNTFGNSCDSNTFGDYCYSNTFGDDCDSNTFGDYCYSNTFGDDCDSNTFGNSCDSNTFGDYCNSNTFGTRTASVKATKDYMRYISVESGVQYVNITCSATTSSRAYAQNAVVHSGVVGTSSTYKTCTISAINTAYLTEFGEKVQGTIS